jgi:hypothetical protein
MHIMFGKIAEFERACTELACQNFNKAMKRELLEERLILSRMFLARSMRNRIPQVRGILSFPSHFLSAL